MIIMKNRNRSYNRGDVVLVLYPHSNLVSAKTRPALVIQNDNIHTGLTQYIVYMITSNVSRAGHSSRVFVALSSSNGKRSGLLSDSVVMTDNIATVKETEIYKKIGTLQMKEIDNALRFTLNL